MKMLFKTCPSCGKKLGVKETDKSLLNREKHTEEFKDIQVGNYGKYRPVIASSTTVSTKRVSVLREEYRHKYKCKNCGHEWAETEFVERSGEGRPFSSSQALLKRQGGKQA